MASASAALVGVSGVDGSGFGGNGFGGDGVSGVGISSVGGVGIGSVGGVDGVGDVGIVGGDGSGGWETVVAGDTKIPETVAVAAAAALKISAETLKLSITLPAGSEALSASFEAQ